MNSIRIFTIFLLLVIPISLLAQIDSGYVALKDCHIFYRTWGEGAPIVFLNGGYGYSSRGYEKYAELLAKNNKVILFDQRGTGRSLVKGPMESYRISFELLVEDLDSIRKYFGYEEWTVMGHSFGGLYAWQYSITHPERIKKMILSATPKIGDKFFETQIFKKPKKRELTDSELKIWDQIKEEEKKKRPSLRKLRILHSALRARYSVLKPENYPAVASFFTNNIRSKHTVLTPMMAPEAVEVTLKDFDQSVLILHGEHDYVKISNARANHEFFPNSILKIFEDSGHMIILDQPEAYAKTIHDFLAEKQSKTE